MKFISVALVELVEEQPVHPGGALRHALDAVEVQCGRILPQPNMPEVLAP